MCIYFSFSLFLSLSLSLLLPPPLSLEDHSLRSARHPSPLFGLCRIQNEHDKMTRSFSSPLSLSRSLSLVLSLSLSRSLRIWRELSPFSFSVQFSSLSRSSIMIAKAPVSPPLSYFHLSENGSVQLDLNSRRIV